MGEHDVWCLTCHAEPGEPCRDGYGGQAVFTHTVRRDTAALKAAGVL
jgi:hypothetical protein